MATPPKGRKMAPERPFPSLIETGKSYSKTGLLPAVLPAVLPTVSRRFAGGALSLKQPRSDSGPSPSSERNYRQFRTHFQAYKPSIAAFSKVCL